MTRSEWSAITRRQAPLSASQRRTEWSLEPLTRRVPSGGKGHAPDPVGMAREHSQTGAALCVPEAHGAVPGAADQASAIGEKATLMTPLEWPVNARETSAALRVPEANWSGRRSR